MPLRDKLASDRLRAEVDALQVDRRDLLEYAVIQLVFPVRIVRIDEEARDVDAGIVDEDVDAAELLLRLLHHCLDARTLRHVSDDVEHLAARFLKCGRLGIHIADDDIRALFQKGLHDRLADPRRTAGNDCGLSFEM